MSPTENIGTDQIVQSNNHSPEVSTRKIIMRGFLIFPPRFSNCAIHVSDPHCWINRTLPDLGVEGRPGVDEEAPAVATGDAEVIVPGRTLGPLTSLKPRAAKGPAQLIAGLGCPFRSP